MQKEGRNVLQQDGERKSCISISVLSSVSALLCLCLDNKTQRTGHNCALLLLWDVSIPVSMLAQRFISIPFSLEALEAAHKLVNGQSQTEAGSRAKGNFTSLHCKMFVHIKSCF